MSWRASFTYDLSPVIIGHGDQHKTRSNRNANGHQHGYVSSRFGRLN